MKPSDIIREARNVLFERGVGHGRFVTDEGPCMLGALCIAAGHEDNLRVRDEISSHDNYSLFDPPGPLRDAAIAVADVIDGNEAADPDTTVLVFNDDACRDGRKGDIFHALHRAELLAKEREL